MRNSKFLLTSLLAAATMSATAWADEITSAGRTISTDTSVDQIYFSASGTLTIDAGAALTITGSTAKAESDVSAAADRSSFSFGNTSRATINVNGTLNLLEASGFGTVWGTMGMIVGNGGVANLKALTVSSNYYNNNGSSVTLETGGTLNLGGGGYKKQYVGSGYADGSIDLTLNGGTLGALDSWSTSDALTASGDVTINTTKYDATNKAYLSGDGAGATISANGGLAGTGKFIISGLGSVSTTNVSVASLEIASGASMTISGALSSASVTNAGTLDLSGANVNLTSAIVNTGFVTISVATVFNLTTSGADVTLISGGAINGIDWNSLTGSNFTYNGAAIVGRGLTSSSVGVVHYDATATAKTLTWNGTSSDTWMEVAVGTTPSSKPWQDEKGVADAFYADDSVKFTSSASVTVAASGVLANTVSITGTVDAPTTLVLSGQSNLTANSIDIGDNATLALGDLGGLSNGVNISHKLTGTGTVSFTKTNGNHDYTVNLGSEFAGTVDIVGSTGTGRARLNQSGLVLGSSSAKVNLTNVWFWSSGSGTIAQTLNFFGTENELENGTLNLSGGVTFKDGAALSVKGGTLNISGSMEGANISQSGGKLNITNGVTVFDVLNVAATATDEIDVTGGTSLTIKSGSILKGLHVKTGTEVNIGDGTKASTLTLARLEMGDNQASGDTLNVRQNATLVITGSDDTTSGDGNPNTGEGSQYKLTGIMLGEWGVTTTANIEGKMLAENASVFSGDKNMTLNVKSGGVLAVKGIGQNKTGKSSTITLDLADNGTLILGSEGITRFGSGTWSASLGAGTIGTSNADGTTISKDMTLTSAAGTTFDTQLWNFAPDGNDIARSADTESSITVNGVISGDGSLKKAGAGTLTLSGNNTYAGGTVIEAGTVVAAHANALGTTKGVEVQSGATLKLGTSDVTVAGLSGAGSVGLADGTDSATLTVNGGGVFTGTLNGGTNSLALVFDADGKTLELNPAFSNTLSSVEIKAGTVKTGKSFALGYSDVSVKSSGALEVTTSTLTSDYGLMLGGITFADGSSFVVDVTGAAENDVLKIITSSVIKFNTGSEDVSLTSDNLDLFVNDFVTLKGWDGLADWAYDGSALSVTLTIPEPSVFGLLAGLGALALAGTRRRRKKA